GVHTSFANRFQPSATSVQRIVCSHTRRATEAPQSPPVECSSSRIPPALPTGLVFVVTEPDCVAEPDWLERLLAHHDAGHRVVGGSIRSLPGLWNQSVHLTKYPWWDPMS